MELQAYLLNQAKNIRAAKRIGWKNCIHFQEQGLEAQRMRKRQDSNSNIASATDDLESVSTLEEVRSVWPEIFKDV